MNGDHDPKPEWWEFDPSEEPVPLSGQARSDFAVADEAESIVRSARDALAREDTDPDVWTRDRRRDWDDAGGLRQRFAVLLLTGCVAMFGLGWVEGSTDRRPLTGTTETRKMKHDTSERLDARSTARRRATEEGRK